MFKIKRYTLQQLQNNYPSLSADELKELIGGTRYEYSNYGIRILDDEGNLVQFLSYNYCEDQYGEDWMYDGFSVDGGSDFEDLEILPIASPSEGTSGSGETEGLNSYLSEKSLLSRLTTDQMRVLSELDITIQRVGYIDGGAQGRYNADNHVIYLLDSSDYNSTDVEYNSFCQELNHAYQEYIGLDLNSKSCLEFQANFIQTLRQFLSNQGSSIMFVGDEHFNEAYSWISDITNDHNYDIPINMNAFKSRVNEFYQYFLQDNSGRPYSQGTNYNFDYKWEEVFRFMGINFK